MSTRKYRKNRGLRKFCSCPKRTWNDRTCTHNWHFNFRSERGSLGTADRNEADARFATIVAQIKNGTYVRPTREAEPAPPVIERPTFAAVAQLYGERHVKPKLSAVSYDNHVYVLAFLAGITVPPGVSFTEKPFHLLTLDDVDTAVSAKRATTVKTYHARRCQTCGRQPRRDCVRSGHEIVVLDRTHTRTIGGKTAARNVRNYLSGLWHWAVAKGYSETNPFNRNGQVPEELRKDPEPPRDRRFVGDEEQRLMAATGPHLADCIVAALESGMRKTEILSLQWKHVRWLANELALEWQNTKTRRARQIPISPTLREVLTRRQREYVARLPKVSSTQSDAERLSSLYVFGNEIGERVRDIKTAWQGACERAKIEDLHFHDLRHEAGSRKIEAGWPLHAVSKWLGHKKITTTDTYLNATTQLLHELNERKPLTLVKG